jgi:hypothetical protein
MSLRKDVPLGPLRSPDGTGGSGGRGDEYGKVMDMHMPMGNSQFENHSIEDLLNLYRSSLLSQRKMEADGNGTWTDAEKENQQSLLTEIIARNIGLIMKVSLFAFATYRQFKQDHPNSIISLLYKDIMQTAFLSFIERVNKYVSTHDDVTKLKLSSYIKKPLLGDIFETISIETIQTPVYISSFIFTHYHRLSNEAKKIAGPNADQATIDADVIQRLVEYCDNMMSNDQLSASRIAQIMHIKRSLPFVYRQLAQSNISLEGLIKDEEEGAHEGMHSIPVDDTLHDLFTTTPTERLLQDTSYAFIFNEAMNEILDVDGATPAQRHFLLELLVPNPDGELPSRRDVASRLNVSSQNVSEAINRFLQKVK